MRKTLIIAAVLGIAGFSTGANAVSTCAQYSVSQCVSNGRYHCVRHQQETFYTQCLNDQAARRRQIAKDVKLGNVTGARIQLTGHTGSAAYHAK